MVKLLTTVLLVLGLVTSANAQGNRRPRFGSKSASGTPVVIIHTPTSLPTWQVSDATMPFEGTCIDDVQCTQVNWTCSGCAVGSTAGTADLSGNGISWSDIVTLTCSGGAGTANSFSVTGTDGVLTSIADTLVVQCIIPDGADPVTTITTNGGVAFGVSTATTSLSGTSTDDVAIDTVVCTNDTTSQDCGAPSLSGTITNRLWTFDSVPLQEGANLITVRSTDTASKQHSDQITITRTTALQVTTTSIPGCRELTAYSAPSFLTAVGGQKPYTWSKLSGSYPAASPAFTLTTGGAPDYAGSLTATPSNGSAGTYPLVFRVTDNLGATADSASLSLVCVDDTAEQRQDYFEYQTNSNGSGGSGRAMCAADNTGSNCILRFDDCADATFGDNGACRFSEDLTAPIQMTTTLAKQQIAGMQPTAEYDNEMGTLRNFTIGYATDPHPNKQLGAKVVLPGAVLGDGYCDDNPPGTGCSDLGGNENAELTFANIDLGTGSGSVTFVVDDWFDSTWMPNGDWSGGGADVVANCPGGGLGGRNMRKQYRIDATGDPIYVAFKNDNRQANTDKYFQLSPTDAGFWDCDDGIISVAYLSAQTSTSKKSGQSLVSPATVGVHKSDSGFSGNGQGAFALTTNIADFPIFHSRWNRRILHIEWGVRANDPKMDAWKDDCYNGDRVSTKGSYEPGAAVDQSAVAGTRDFTCANMLTNPDPDLSGTPLLDTINEQSVACATPGDAGCASKWVLLSAWIGDEVRGFRRIAYRVPWWTQNPGTSTNALLRLFQVEYDASTPSCLGCVDAAFYQGPVFAIVNINAADIDDTGCPSACLGEGTMSSNLFRKPVR